MSPGQTGHITGQMGRVPGTVGTHTRGCPAKILYVLLLFFFPPLLGWRLAVHLCSPSPAFFALIHARARQPASHLLCPTGCLAATGLPLSTPKFPDLLFLAFLDFLSFFLFLSKEFLAFLRVFSFLSQGF